MNAGRLISICRSHPERLADFLQRPDARSTIETARYGDESCLMVAATFQPHLLDELFDSGFVSRELVEAVDRKGWSCLTYLIIWHPERVPNLFDRLSGLTDLVDRSGKRAADYTDDPVLKQLLSS